MNPSVCMNFLFFTLTEFNDFKSKITEMQNNYFEANETDLKENLINFESNVQDQEDQNESYKNSSENNNIKIFDYENFQNKIEEEDINIVGSYNNSHSNSKKINLFNDIESVNNIDSSYKKKSIFEIKPQIENDFVDKKRDSFFLIEKDNNRTKQDLLIKSLFNNIKENHSEINLNLQLNLKNEISSSSNSTSKHSGVFILKNNETNESFNKIQTKDSRQNNSKKYSMNDNFINISEQSSDLSEKFRKFSDFTNAELIDHYKIKESSDKSKESDFFLIGDGNSNQDPNNESFCMSKKSNSQINSGNISQKQLFGTQMNNNPKFQKKDNININFRRNRRIYSNADLRKINPIKNIEMKNSIPQVNSSESLLFSNKEKKKMKNNASTNLIINNMKINEKQEDYKSYCRGESNSFKNLEKSIQKEKNSFEDSFVSKYNSIENHENNSFCQIKNS